ncbi:hypothetical protein AAG906_035892 [Vitis piasezkii]
MWFLLFIQSPLLSGGITSSLILSLAFGTLGTMFILVGGRVEETSQPKEKSKEKQGGKQRTAAAVFVGTFGALPEVHFLHAIYHFKAQEVKNPTLQTVYDLELKRGRYGLRKTTAPGVRKVSHTPYQTTSEDVFSEDERLNFGFLEQVISVHGDALVYLSRVKDHLEWQVLGERYEPLQDASEKKQVTGTSFLYEEPEPSDLNSKKHFSFTCDLHHKFAEEAMNFMSYVAEVSRG